MNCPTCGNPIEQAGFCPACMLAGGLAQTTLHTQAMDEAPSLLAESALEADHFGAYEIERLLGEGGMGTVYLARQTHPIVRKVALKVVKPGMDTAKILNRFEYERQAVARMDHPNIARVYDASATQKGRPFFVMEYVDGQPITTWCDEHRLNTRERLELFAPVCQAVQHAHQRGILHRDIKPSNVLVTEVDGKPVPKIIDFGIAKALDQQAFDKTAFTEFGQFIGTPEYMSPEAADPIAADVDASSDVYSLGVLLYELLIGAVPFDGKSLRKAGLVELMRIIREEDAPALTRKLTQLGASATEIAARRSTDISGLKRQVQGDLNLIVLKAVDKSRARRYPTPSDLLADIGRHLADLPVSAAPPSPLYRFTKYAKRNRTFLAAAAAVTLAATLGLIGTLTQAREAIRERQRAEAAARQANTQSAQLAQTLSDLRQMTDKLLFEFDEELEALPSSTITRHRLIGLGMEYLRRAEARSAQSADFSLGGAYLQIALLHDKLYENDLADGFYRRAQQALTQQLSRQPNNRQLRLQLAKATAGNLRDTAESSPQRNFDASREILKKLLAEDPHNAAALLFASRLHLATGEIRAAVSTSRAAYESSGRALPYLAHYASTFALYHHSLAPLNVALVQRELPPLISILEKELQSRPAHTGLRTALAQASQALGLALAETQNLERGIALLSQAHNLARDRFEEDPTDGEALNTYLAVLNDYVSVLGNSTLNSDALPHLNRGYQLTREFLSRKSVSRFLVPQLGSKSSLWRTAFGRTQRLQVAQDWHALLTALLAKHPGDPVLQRELAFAQAQIARSFGILGRYSEARQAASLAVRLAGNLNRQNPSAVNLRMWSRIQSLATADLVVGAYRLDANRASENSLETARRILREHPADSQSFPIAIDSLTNRTNSRIIRFDYLAAISPADETIALARQWLRSPDPAGSSIERQLALINALHLRSFIATNLADHQTSLPTAAQAARLACQLLQQDPLNTSHALRCFFQQQHLAEVQLRAGQHEPALQSMSALGERLAALLDQTPSIALSRRVAILVRQRSLAELYQTAFQFEQARALNESVLAALEQLQRNNAQTQGLTGHINRCWQNLGRLWASLGQPERAAKYFELQLAHLRRANPDSFEAQSLASILHQLRLPSSADRRQATNDLALGFEKAIHRLEQQLRSDPSNSPNSLSLVYVSLQLTLLLETLGDRTPLLSAVDRLLAFSRNRLALDPTDRGIVYQFENAAVLHRFFHGSANPFDAVYAHRVMGWHGARLEYLPHYSLAHTAEAVRLAKQLNQTQPSIPHQVELANAHYFHAENLLLLYLRQPRPSQPELASQARHHYSQCLEILQPLAAKQRLPYIDEYWMLVRAPLALRYLNSR